MSATDHWDPEKRTGADASAPAATAEKPDYDVTPAPSTRALDDTYEVYRQNADLTYTPAEAKKVLRKIDIRIVPMLFVIYMLQYLDKVRARQTEFVDGLGKAKDAR